MPKTTTPSLTIAPHDQRRIWFIAEINGERSSQNVAEVRAGVGRRTAKAKGKSLGNSHTSHQSNKPKHLMPIAKSRVPALSPFTAASAK